jgi:hypothetical protein
MGRPSLSCDQVTGIAKNKAASNRVNRQKKFVNVLFIDNWYLIMLINLGLIKYNKF